MPAVNGVGEPCAGEPHARFDGRELETEQTGQGHGVERPDGKPRSPRLRDLPPKRVTAPALDPTTGGSPQRSAEFVADGFVAEPGDGGVGG